LYNIAELRHRIEFQRLQKTSDGQGGYEASYTVLQSCWAKIKATSAQERVYAQKLEDIYSHEIIIRNTLDHTPQIASDKIFFNNRYFQIKSIEHIDERKFWLRILVQEGVAS
jgi:SPP1 family predicted phage head-tail adaptor